MTTNDRIKEIEEQAADAIGAAASTDELEQLRVRYHGRKAELTTILRGIADLPASERGAVGTLRLYQHQRRLDGLEHPLGDRRGDRRGGGFGRGAWGCGHWSGWLSAVLGRPWPGLPGGAVIGAVGGGCTRR